MAKKLILLGIILMFASIATAETVFNPLNKRYADTLYCPISGGCGASSSNLSANLSGVAYMNRTNGGNFTADNFFGFLNFSWVQNWMGTISALINGNFTLLDNKITNESKWRIDNESQFIKNSTDFYANNFNASWYNWKAIDGWNIFNGINLTFNTTKLDAYYFNATQYDNISGKIDGGTLANTQHPNAAYDEVTLNFSEVSGSPGLDLRINFTGVDTFNQGIIRYKTSTLSGANPIIQVWNYVNSAWEDYPTFGESLSFATVFQPVFDSSNHISNGVVQVRLYKVSNGNTNNHYYIDWVALQKGYSTFSGEEIDPKFTEKIKNYWNISQINETFATQTMLNNNISNVIQNSSNISISTKLYISTALNGSIGTRNPPQYDFDFVDLWNGSRYNLMTFNLENTAQDGRASYQMKNPQQTWQFLLLGADGERFEIYDVTWGKYPVKIAVNSQTNAFVIVTSGNIGFNTTIPDFPLTINRTVAGFSLWTLGNISATGYNTRTSIFDKTKNPFDYIKSPDEYLDSKGNINDSKFYGYSKSKYNYTDDNNITTERVIEGVELGKEIDNLREAVRLLKIEVDKLKAEKI